MNNEICVICENKIEEKGLSFITLKEKGSAGINRASEERSDLLTTTPGQKVHVICRRDYCLSQNIARSKKQSIQSLVQPTNSHRSLVRKAESTFSFKTDCFYCGTTVNFHEKKRTSDAFRVTTLETKNTVLKICSNRGNDSWAELVRGRILNVHDLPAADAIYHQTCSVNFRTGKQIPKHYSLDQPGCKKSNIGRPHDEERSEAFRKVMLFLKENDDEQITLQDLDMKMQEYLEDSGSTAQPFGRTHMKTKIREHFGDQIIISKINGKPNVVTFRSTAETILHEFHVTSKKVVNRESEKNNIIQTAASLIKSDIKAMKTSNDNYPHIDNDIETSLDFLPEALLLLLRCILFGGKDDLKLASIGQAIVQAARPRVVIAPLQIGLGVQLHHGYASRFLIDTLHRHGFCSSYSEVFCFRQNAAVDQGTDIPAYDGQFVQYVADNVDHNIRTLDGNNTFHGMGMIATVTPGTKSVRSVPRQQVKPKEILSSGRVQIQPPTWTRLAHLDIKYQDIVIQTVHDPTANLDILWKCSLLFGTSRPSWSGIAQALHQGCHKGQSSVMFLPMIDMNPSDETCINSTLMFVSEHAKSHDIATPIITFDQPLWWKAFNIIHTEPADSALRNVIVRLGAFHAEMSFIGSVGHLMADSGLRDILELIYASNAVDHILTGKAIARAVRAHFIVDAALNTLLYSAALKVPIRHDLRTEDYLDETEDPTVQLISESDTEIEASNVENSTTHGQSSQVNASTSDLTFALSDEVSGQSSQVNASTSDLTPECLGESRVFNEKIPIEEVHTLFDDVLTKKMTVAEVSSSKLLKKIEDCVRKKGLSLREGSRTAALWLQYMEMVDILRQLIKAERTGNWELHLQTLKAMLPYLAASGHNNYVKSIHLYLQTMTDLPKDHPDVYQSFLSGLHVVRRSDRFWAGLPTDLIIEQVLMRSLKTSGGLTRGTGMTEQQRMTWLLSMPACAEINKMMQELTGVQYNSGEQNKDMTDARQQRDMKDTITVLTALNERNPFTSGPNLRNVMNGVNADNSVNVDNAKVIGEKILTSMTGKPVGEYSFKKNAQAVTLASKSKVGIDNDIVQVDPQLLFQRLVLASNNSDDMEGVFKYELCSYPTALFDSPLMLRQPQKPALADALWAKLTSDATSGPSDDVRYVLDGGALLHRIPWPRGSPTYKEVCTLYCRYVTKKYGTPVVVFDGYEGLSTKNMTQCRRSSGKVGATVTGLSEDMRVSMKKDHFLSNSKNKQLFIKMLSHFLDRIGCETHHATGDADVLIVKTALESARTMSTVLIGDDTDLLVLLCYFTSPDFIFDIHFKPEPKANSSKRRVWNIKKVQQQWGSDVCHNILYIHAIVGCDTTSRIHGIGKGAALKKFVSCPYFQEQGKVFATHSTQNDIETAGENALVCLYNGKPGDTLDNLRYTRYREKLASKSSHIQPQNLPPTSAAAKYHSFRVYHQIRQWKGEDLPLESWGWSMRGDDQIVPVMTDLPAAPESLLHVVRCNCSGDCSTRRCSCRKNGLECSTVCGQCKGSACTNSTMPLHDDANECLL